MEKIFGEYKDSKSLLEEYKNLNKKIEKLLDETNMMAKYAIIGTVSAWAWFTSHPNSYSTNTFLLWLPTVFCAILGIRSLVLTKEILDLGTFIAPIESAMGIPANLGWEQDLKTKRMKGKKQLDPIKLTGYISGSYLSALVYWLLLFILTILIPMVISNLGSNLVVNK